MAKLHYQFKYISLDHYEFIYKDKTNKEQVIPFTRTIEMASELQGIVAKARIKLFKELTSNGMTKNDLIIEKKVGNTTVYDETNYVEFEKKYIETESIETINNILKKCMNKSIEELFTEMGIDLNNVDTETTNQIAIFTQKFVSIITGGEEQDKIPSRNENENKLEEQDNI